MTRFINSEKSLFFILEQIRLHSDDRLFEIDFSVKTFIRRKTVSFFVSRLVQHVYTFHLVLHCSCYCLDTRNDVDRFSSFETPHIQKVSDCFFSPFSSSPFDEAKRLYCSEGHSNISTNEANKRVRAGCQAYDSFFFRFLYRRLSQGNVLLWLIEIRFPS